MSLLNGGLNILGLAKKVAPPIVFAGALTADIQGDINAQPTMGGKLKTIANAIVGRTTNLNPFGDVPKYSMKINPSGMWNPYTQSAVTMIGIGLAGQYLGKRLGIPGLGKIGQLKGLGGAILPAALAGGLFDDKAQSMQPVGLSGQNGYSQPAQRQAAPAGYSTQNTSYTAMRASSGGQVTADIKASAF